MKTVMTAAAMAVTMLAGAAAQAAPRPAKMPGGMMSYDAKKDRYCFTASETPTGTRLAQTWCKTAAQWKELGMEVGRRN